MSKWNIAVVVPCRNEASNISDLVESINCQNSNHISIILFIENASTDNTLSVISSIHSKIPVSVESLLTSGGLAHAAEFTAFLYGANKILSEVGDLTHVMKLDADVRLNSDYFDILTSNFVGDGLLGSPNPGEHKNVISGAARIYSREAFQVLKNMPQALGFDVLDEVYISNRGHSIEVFPETLFTLARSTGGSEGLLRGRFRVGATCKLVGYSFPYFLIKVLKYVIRKPILLGSVSMFWGYVKTNYRIYPEEVTAQYRKIQYSRLISTLKKNSLGALIFRGKSG